MLVRKAEGRLSVELRVERVGTDLLAVLTGGAAHLGRPAGGLFLLLQFLFHSCHDLAHLHAQRTADPIKRLQRRLSLSTLNCA